MNSTTQEEAAGVPSQEVTFDSGGCAIAGTFTEAADPVAAALLITGGGRSDRNSDARLPGGWMLRTGVDKAVAGALAGARVCALRYDKRGPAASRCSPSGKLITSWIKTHWAASLRPAAQSPEPPPHADHV